MRYKLGRLSFIAAIILCISPSFAFDPIEIIDHRQNEMKFAQNLVRNIKADLLDQNTSEAFTSARKLEDWSHNLEALFPEGSEASMQNLSSASAAIWENPQAFDKAINMTQNQITKLIRALSTGDFKEAMIINNGLTTTCRACHQRFRN